MTNPARLAGGAEAGFLQTFCLDHFSGRKIRRNSQDNLTGAKRGDKGIFEPGAPVKQHHSFALGALGKKKVNLKAYKFAAEKKSLGRESSFFRF